MEILSLKEHNTALSVENEFLKRKLLLCENPHTTVKADIPAEDHESTGEYGCSHWAQGGDPCSRQTGYMPEV